MSNDGRIFFTGTNRSLIEEDVIRLSSVGVDIGSSTSHLLFSTIVLERLDSRYVVADRIIEYQSDILITPYRDGDDIDANTLGGFIEEQYTAAGRDPDEIDTGALILTGIAVRRKNARAIGDLFSEQAGKFVSVSAGDGLETMMAAHGSGALALSIKNQRRLLNIDVGGGTTKIAICDDGEVVGYTALEVGARLIVVDNDNRVVRIEPTGQAYLNILGIETAIGDRFDEPMRSAVAVAMADNIHAAAMGVDLGPILRLPPLPDADGIMQVVFSGGVSEFINTQVTQSYNDLGPELGCAIRQNFEGSDIEIVLPLEGIRATVVGASQYTVQVSGSTIYLDPPETLPLRNVPVIKPGFDFAGDIIPADLAAAIEGALERLDLQFGKQPVAVAIPWRGTARYHRLQALSRGVINGLEPILAHGHPLVMVFDGDIGGLIGLHCRQEERLANAVVSIDGIELQEFDFIDIGEVLPSTGAVPVAIKSLLFPGLEPVVSNANMDVSN